MKRLEVILTCIVLYSGLRSRSDGEAIEAFSAHCRHQFFFTLALLTSSMIHRALTLHEGPPVRLVSLRAILLCPEWGQRTFCLQHSCIIFCRIIIKRLLNFTGDSYFLTRAIRLLVQLKSTYSIKVASNFLWWKVSFRVISIHQQVHTVLRFVALLIGHCSSSTFWEEFPFEAGICLGEAVNISQCLIELSFIYLC